MKLERHWYRSASAICAAPRVTRPWVGSPYPSLDGQGAGRADSASVRSLIIACSTCSTGVRVVLGLAWSAGERCSGTATYTLTSQRTAYPHTNLDSARLFASV